jgi:hypothetical protein
MSEITIPFHGGKLVVPEREAASAWLDKVLNAAPSPAKLNISLPPALGEYWAGEGGIFAGFMPDGDGSQYPLIVSVDDFAPVEWGAYGEDEPGAKSDVDGWCNTLALLESCHSHPAAQLASGYTKDGHSDFFLPAKRQISLCMATIPEKFGKAWYWTSTQYSAYHAWGQSFGGGYQSNAYKHGKGRVRLVRRSNFKF